MLQQMAWLPARGGDGTKILHLRTVPDRGWQPYTTCSDRAVPDYPIDKGSKGYATFHKLLNEGWQLIPSDRAAQLSWTRHPQSA